MELILGEIDLGYRKLKFTRGCLRPVESKEQKGEKEGKEKGEEPNGRHEGEGGNLRPGSAKLQTAYSSKIAENLRVKGRRLEKGRQTAVLGWDPRQ